MIRLARCLLPAPLLLLALLAGGCDTPADPRPAAETTPAPARTVHTLRMATTWPSNYPVFSDSIARFVERVKTMSDGALQIQVDSANKHKAPFGVLDLVKAGQYQLGHTASYYWKGKDPSAMFFTTMPFGMTAPEQYAWFYHGGGLELMQQVYARHGVYSFPAGNTGVQMGGWFRQEITRLEDLQGLKMRIPGFAGEVLARLGVVVTNIPPGELSMALERGTIDALEWVGPAFDLNMGFHKVAPYYYTGWHEPAAELQFLVNRAAFDGLPAPLQTILTTAMQAAALDYTAQAYHANAAALASLRQDHPEVQLRSFPQPILTALKATNQALLEELAGQDPRFGEILAAQRAYLAQVRPWTRTSDYTYLRDNLDE